jgi:hypothetical protein
MFCPPAPCEGRKGISIWIAIDAKRAASIIGS